MLGVAEDGADEEGAGGGGKAEQLSGQGQAEAEGQAGYEQGLVGLIAGDEVDQAGSEEGAEHQGSDAEDNQFAGQEQDRAGIGASGLGRAGQHGEQDHRREVLDHENANHEAAPGAEEAAGVAEHLDQDGRAADAHRRSQEDAFQQRPTQEVSGLEPGGEHDGHLDEGDDHNPGADLPDALPAQFEADAEEKQHQAEVGEQANCVHVADQGRREGKGADNDSGHQVSEDRRLLDEAKEDQRRAGDGERNGKVAYQAELVAGRYEGKGKDDRVDLGGLPVIRWLHISYRIRLVGSFREVERIGGKGRL